MNFTKDELYEIEKVFDYNATHILIRHQPILALLNDASRFTERTKILNGILKSYDMARTISAKCQLSRTIKKKKKVYGIGLINGNGLRK